MHNKELATYIQTELHKEVSPEVIRDTLLQAGWQTEDIAAAFVSGQYEIADLNWNAIWGWGIPGMFISTSLLAYISGLEDIVMIWYPTAGLGLLVVIGYILLGIFKRKMSYIKTAIIMLVMFVTVGGGACLFNIEQISFH